MTTKPRFWLIESPSEKGFWSNDWGWVLDVESATRFTREEAERGRLLITLEGDARPILERDATNYDDDQG